MTDPSSGNGGTWEVGQMEGLTIQGAGTNPVPVTVSVSAHGTFFWDNLLGVGQQESLSASVYLTFGPEGGAYKTSQFSYQFNRLGVIEDNGGVGVGEFYEAHTLQVTVKEITVSKSEFNVVVYAVLQIAPGSSCYFGTYINGSYGGSKGPGAGMNFMDPSNGISVSLPPGYSFTSSSGKFLTRPIPISALLTSPVVISNKFTFSFPTTASSLYDVQRIDSVGNTNWTTFTSNIPGTGLTANIAVPFSNSPQTFFRVLTH